MKVFVEKMTENETPVSCSTVWDLELWLEKDACCVNPTYDFTTFFIRSAANVRSSAGLCS